MLVAGLHESAAIRLTLVAVVLLAVQFSILSELRPANLVVDLIAVLCAGLGSEAGPRRGGRAAFFVGLAFDLLLPTTLGVKALTYGLGAFAVGCLPVERARGLRTLTFAGACAGMALGEGLVAAIFGAERAVSLSLVGAIVLGAVVGAGLGPVATRVARWTMMAGERPRL